MCQRHISLTASWQRTTNPRPVDPPDPRPDPLELHALHGAVAEAADPHLVAADVQRVGVRVDVDHAPDAAAGVRVDPGERRVQAIGDPDGVRVDRHARGLAADGDLARAQVAGVDAGDGVVAGVGDPGRAGRDVGGPVADVDRLRPAGADVQARDSVRAPGEDPHRAGAHGEVLHAVGKLDDLHDAVGARVDAHDEARVRPDADPHGAVARGDGDDLALAREADGRAVGAQALQ